MGQLGFFDLSRRYEGLDVKDDPLVAIAAMTPWESLRPRTQRDFIPDVASRAALAGFVSRASNGGVLRLHHELEPAALFATV
jgi:hypothetical protein